ncbi:MAG: hypothetical protein GY746_12460 [Gammaproteobacteria bacterium]|nr:hypothetical protein [Gammaproteobacteria bacterium]
MIGFAAFYNDGAEQEILPTSGLVPVFNDALDGKTVLNSMPVGVNAEWENPAGVIKFTGLEVGDQLMLTHRFSVTPDANEGLLITRFDVGAVLDYHKYKMDRGANRLYKDTITQHLIVNSDLIADGLKVVVRSTVPAAYTYRGVEITIIKRNA